MVARLDMKVFPAGVPAKRPDDPTAKAPHDEEGIVVPSF